MTAEKLAAQISPEIPQARMSSTGQFFKPSMAGLKGNDLLGIWFGWIRTGTYPIKRTIIFTQYADGSLHALVEGNFRRSSESVLVENQGNHISIQYHTGPSVNGGVEILDGVLNINTGEINAIWKSSNNSFPIILTRKTVFPAGSVACSPGDALKMVPKDLLMQPATFEGVWNGPGNAGQRTLVISRTANGWHAVNHFCTVGWTFQTDNVDIKDNHFKIQFYNNFANNTYTLEGDMHVDAEYLASLAGTESWTDKTPQERKFKFSRLEIFSPTSNDVATRQSQNPIAAQSGENSRQQINSADYNHSSTVIPTGVATSSDLTPGPSAQLRLDEFSHALDVQLADELRDSKLFTIIEAKDINQAIQSAAVSGDVSTAGQRTLAIAGVDAIPTLSKKYQLPSQSSLNYDLKNADTRIRFKNAGINFLLVTTLEDLDENHIDGATVTREFEYAGGHKTGWWVEDLTDGADGYGYGSHQTALSWKVEIVHVSPMKQKEQSLRVTLRSRLYNVSTGEVLGSKVKTYARGRSYTASAQGSNELSMGDLYAAAAKDLADWQRIIVEDQAFPIKIVKVEDDGLLINRGSESGIRRNAIYDVWQIGDEIKDPDNGEILGREEKNVGKVIIRELQSKFSKAATSEDTGIKVGNVLRLHIGS